jgi:hypothetical protein
MKTAARERCLFLRLHPFPAFKITQNNLLLHTDTREVYKGTRQKKKNWIYGGNIEIIAISEFIVPFRVHVVSKGPKNHSTIKYHLVILQLKETGKQEMLSILEKVCFYREPLKKHFLQIAYSLSAYCYSIKISIIAQM